MFAELWWIHALMKLKRKLKVTFSRELFIITTETTSYLIFWQCDAVGSLLAWMLIVADSNLTVTECQNKFKINKIKILTFKEYFTKETWNITFIFIKTLIVCHFFLTSAYQFLGRKITSCLSRQQYLFVIQKGQNHDLLF